MKMYKETQEVRKYLNVPLECDCGRVHYAAIKDVNISKGAIGYLPHYMQNYGYKKPYIICDSITYEIAAKKCENILADAGYAPFVLVLKHTEFDEATLGEIVLNKPDDCDIMIGCGTGSITDMLRFSSFKLGIPCFTVPTAAPMDGFAASVGIMNVNNLKATMPAHATELIIGDTDILKNAPYRMTIAGFGDLVAKVNALNDWRLSVLIKGEHYCRHIDNLVEDYVNDIIRKKDRIKAHDPDVIGELMNALILTGATISLYGNSRPISGAEHHMSHYWEALGDQRGKPFAMHGEQVAVGTVLALMIVEEIKNIKPDFSAAKFDAEKYNAEEWKKEIQRAYGMSADAIIELENKTGKNEVAARISRINKIEKIWQEIIELFNGLSTSAYMKNILQYVSCPCTPKEIGVDEKILRDTFKYCKDTRDRYTVLQLMWDLGITDSVTERVLERLRKSNAI